MLKHLKSNDAWSQKSLGAKGFTLIELLVVIVILGVLGAVVVFSVRGVTEDSEQASCRTEKRTISTAVEAYYAMNNSPATTVAQLRAAGLLAKDASDTAGNWTIAADGEVTGTCPR